MRWVLDRFGAARLLTFDRDPATREPTVEVAHEALLREWPRLVGWLEEDRDLLRALDALSTASSVWDESGETADLLRGPRLAQALDVLATAPERLRPLDRAFIDASQSLADEEREAERRRAQRLRRLNAAVSVALVLALIAGLVAFIQREEAVVARVDAEHAARETERAAEASEQSAEEARAAERAAEAALADAEVGQLISNSAALVGDRPELATLVALEAYRRKPGPATVRAVLDALASLPGRVTRIALPNLESACAVQERLTVSADRTTGFLELDGRLVTIDLRSGNVTDRGPAPAECVRWIGDEEQDVRWVSHSRLESRGAGGGFVDLTTIWTGSWAGPLEEIDLPRAKDVLDAGLAGNRVLLAGSESDLLLLEATSGGVVNRIPRASVVGGSTLLGDEIWVVGDDGRRVVGGGRTDAGLDAGLGELVLVDGRTGDTVDLIELDAVPSAVSIHDGVALVGLRSGRVMEIDLDSGEVLADVASTSAAAIVATGMRFDGRVVAVAQDRIEVLDLDTETVVSSLSMNAESAVVQPDGTAVVFDADGPTASIVDMGASVLAERVIDVSDDAVVGFGAGRVASVLPTGTVEMIDLDSSARSVVDFDIVFPGFGAIAAFPTETGFVAFGSEGTIAKWQDGDVVLDERLWDTEQLVSFAVPGFFGLDRAHGPADASGGAVVVFTTDAHILLNSRVYLVDWATGVVETRLIDAGFVGVSAVPAGNGGVHIASESGLIRTYDSEDRFVAETAVPLHQPVVAARSDQGLLAVSGIGGVVILDPFEEGSSVVIESLGTVAGLAFVDDGRRLVTLEGDGTVRLWDVTTGASVGMLSSGAESGSTPPSTPWFDPERGTVWVASSGRLLEFSLDPARWIEQACEFVERDLTQDEWDRYVPGDEPLQSACS